MSVHKGKTTVINSAPILMDPLHVAVPLVTLWMPMGFRVQVSPSVMLIVGICRQAYKRLVNVVLTVTKDHMRLL